MADTYLPRYTVGIEEGPVVFTDFRRINKIELVLDGIPLTEEEFRLHLSKDKHYCHLANLYRSGCKILEPDNRAFLAGHIFYQQTVKQFNFTNPLVIDRLAVNPSSVTIKVDPSINLVNEIRSALLIQVINRLTNSVIMKEIVFPVRISDVELANFMKGVRKGIFKAFFAGEYFPDKEDACVFVCSRDKLQERTKHIP